MAEGIAGRGELGALGRPYPGQEADWVSKATRDVFHEKLDAFAKSLRGVAYARRDAEKAVASLQGWVELGAQMVQIIGPILEVELDRRAAEAAQPVPTWSDKLGAALEDFAGVRDQLKPIWDEFRARRRPNDSPESDRVEQGDAADAAV